MKLTMKEIAFLAEQFPQRTNLSLFSNVTATPDGTEEASLADKKILQNGKLSEEAKVIFDVIANAKQASRLIIRDSLTSMETYAYRVDETIALVENKQDNLECSLPDDFSAIGYDIARFTGLASLKTTAVEAQLSREEAMTMLAMIDIYRTSTLRIYLGDEVADSIAANDIQAQWKSESDNSLVQMFRVNYGYREPAEDALEGILKQLIKKGCVIERNGYQLSPEYGLFSKQFLIPETSILVESFSINEEGELIVGGGMGLVAGIRDQVFFIVDNEELEMKAVAGLEMIETIEGFLACPEL